MDEINTSASNFIYDFIDEDTFVYFDPPYRPLSSTSSFNKYSASSFNDNSQRELKYFIDAIVSKNAKFLLSNSDTKDGFFDELYKGYKIDKINALRVINSKSESRGKITELFISNFVGK